MTPRPSLLVIIGSRQQVSKIHNDKIIVRESTIKPVKMVHSLGAWFDSHTSMNSHIGKVCNKAFRSLYNIALIRKFLSEETTKILLHAYVTAHLDYRNTLHYGFPQYQYDRLQRVFNAAARVVCLVPEFNHITSVLSRLHWLPVRYRVTFKMLLQVYKALHAKAPPYISGFLKAKPVGLYNLLFDG